MRLDHLLSKEEEVRVVLLSRCQGVMRQFYEDNIRCVYTEGCEPRKRAIRRTAEPKYANAYEVKGVRRMTDERHKIFLVTMRIGDTPVLIPNTMVKTYAADGTMLETIWESRWLPD